MCLLQLCCDLMYSFSFQAYGDPCALHSFPTRRSSDLAEPAPVAHAVLEAGAGRRLGLARRHRLHVLLAVAQHAERRQDRKSTRLNSSHLVTSYAVFCLKKK